MLKKCFMYSTKKPVMYFISSAFPDYTSNKRSHFENLLTKPVNGTENLIRVDSLHIQKKIDVIDDEVIFIVYRSPNKNNETAQKKHGLKGTHALFEYSISQHNRSCVACIKILKGYYPAGEFVRSFNLFTVKYLESKIILQLKTANKIMLNVGGKAEIYASAELIDILGLDKKIFKNAKNSMINSNKFRIHGKIFNHKKHLKLKKIKTGIYQPLKDYNKNKYVPQIIKIYCDQVENTIESNEIKKLLVVLPGFNDNDCNKYNHYPINPLLLKLDGTFINSFNFKLADEKGELLKLSSGFATYIKVSLLPIEKNQKMARQEYLTCLSSDSESKNMYPENSNNSFNIHLPKVLEKGSYKKWYMSLLNISLPTVTPNVHEGDNRITIHNEKNEQIAKIFVPVAYYSSAQKIIDVIQKTMLNAGIETALKEYNEKTGRISFTNLSVGKKNMKISTNLALLLGLINDATTTLTVKLELDPGDPYVGEFEPDLKITENSYCKLLCDQICSTYFGESNEEILRFLPLQKPQDEKHYFQEFYQKIRVEINSSTLSRLCFRLTKENTSETIEFQDKDISTHLTILIEREN